MPRDAAKDAEEIKTLARQMANAQMRGDIDLFRDRRDALHRLVNVVLGLTKETHDNCNPEEAKA